jgi:hexosaminidase
MTSKRLLFFLLLASVTATVNAAESGTSKESKPQQPVDWAALFKMHWDNRVKAFKEQNLALQNVVLLGDSITEGFDLARYLPGRRVLNRGIGADIIGNDLPPDDPRGVLRRLDNSVFDCAATDVFLMIGINDLNMGHTVDQLETGYRELLKRIKEHSPSLKIHVQSLLPTRGMHAKQNAPVNEFNRRLRKLAAEFGYDYIDLHKLMVDEQGELKAEWTEDGLHITEPGYLVWRTEILKAMGW